MRTAAAVLSVMLFCVMLVFCDESAAQDQCGVELKLLISSTDLGSSIEKLNARRESSGEVYFFDTDRHDLFLQGVILRFRSGTTSDITVKLRPLGNKQFQHSIGPREKCEVDLNGSESSTSYSIRLRVPGMRVPETGSDVYGELSTDQKELLRATQVKIDWIQVKRVASIKVTDWQITSKSHFNKMTMELWEWPGGRILELSSKVRLSEGATKYEDLQRLVIGKGIGLSGDQRSKTRIVLEPSVPTTVH